MAEDAEVVVDPQKLPRRLISEYRGGRVNSNASSEFLLDLVEALHGSPVMDRLLNSCFGKLFKLPIRKCSLAGKLVHHLVVRQLVTKKKHEMWFLFAGKPLRYSLREFWIVTGLPCHPYSEDQVKRKAQDTPAGNPKFWDTLMGQQTDVKIEEIIQWLKKEPGMEEDRKLRLALIVIVEGVLNCGKDPGKATLAIVELVRNVDEFLKYPWGRDCFEKTLELIQVGSVIKNEMTLADKCLLNSHILVRGFPLAIQLIALKAIPFLQSRLPTAEDENTFTDRAVKQMAKLRKFTKVFMGSAEAKEDVKMDPIITAEEENPNMEELSWSDEVNDVAVDYLQGLIESGGSKVFRKEHWLGGATKRSQERARETLAKAGRVDVKEKCDVDVEEGSQDSEDGDDQPVDDQLEKKLTSLICKLNRENRRQIEELVVLEFGRQRELLEDVMREVQGIKATMSGGKENKSLRMESRQNISTRDGSTRKKTSVSSSGKQACRLDRRGGKVREAVTGGSNERMGSNRGKVFSGGVDERSTMFKRTDARKAGMMGKEDASKGPSTEEEEVEHEKVSGNQEHEETNIEVEGKGSGGEAAAGAVEQHADNVVSGSVDKESAMDGENAAQSDYTSQGDNAAQGEIGASADMVGVESSHLPAATEMATGIENPGKGQSVVGGVETRQVVMRHNDLIVSILLKTSP